MKDLALLVSIFVLFAVVPSCGSSSGSGKKKEGEPCTKTSDCESGLNCWKQICTAETTDQVTEDAVNGDVTVPDVKDGFVSKDQAKHVWSAPKKSGLLPAFFSSREPP